MLFEDTIFAIAPTAVFLFLAPFRTFHLWKKPTRVKKSSLYVAKLVSKRIRVALDEKHTDDDIESWGCLVTRANRRLNRGGVDMEQPGAINNSLRSLELSH